MTFAPTVEEDDEGFGADPFATAAAAAAAADDDDEDDNEAGVGG